MANYTIKFSSTDDLPKTNGKSSFEVPEGSTNITNTPFVLHGSLSTNYGKDIWNNMVYLLENFCRTNPPNSNTMGQLWFDSSNQTLKVYRTMGSNAQMGYLPVSPINETEDLYITENKPLTAGNIDNYITSNTPAFDNYYITKGYANKNYVTASTTGGLSSFSNLLSYDNTITLSDMAGKDNVLVSKKYVDTQITNKEIPMAGIGPNGKLGGVRIATIGGIDINEDGEISIKGYKVSSGLAVYDDAQSSSDRLNKVDLATASSGAFDKYFATVAYVNEKAKNQDYATDTTAGGIKIGKTLTIANGVTNVTGMSYDNFITTFSNTIIFDDSIKSGDKYNKIPSTGNVDATYDNYFATKKYVWDMVVTGTPSSPSSKLTLDTSVTPNTLTASTVNFKLDNTNKDNGINSDDVKFNPYVLTKSRADTAYIKTTALGSRFDNTKRVNSLNLISYGGDSTLTDYDLVYKKYVDEKLSKINGSVAGMGITDAIAIEGTVSDKRMVIDASLISKTDNNGIINEGTSGNSYFNKYFTTKGYNDTRYVKILTGTFDNTVKTIANKIAIGGTIEDTDTDATLVTKKYVDGKVGSSSPAGKLTLDSTKNTITLGSNLIAFTDENGIQNDNAEFNRSFLTRFYADKRYIKQPATAPTKAGMYLVSTGTGSNAQWAELSTGKWTSTGTSITVDKNLIGSSTTNGITGIDGFDSYFLTMGAAKTNFIQKPTNTKSKYLGTDAGGNIVWNSINQMPDTAGKTGILVSEGGTTSNNYKYSIGTQNQVPYVAKSTTNVLFVGWRDTVDNYIKPDTVTPSTSITNELTLTSKTALTSPDIANYIPATERSKTTSDYDKYFATKSYVDNYHVTYGTYDNTIATKVITNKISYNTGCTITDTDSGFTLTTKKYVDDKLATFANASNETVGSASTTATTAQTTAETAQATAETAQTTADAAITTANEAKTSVTNLTTNVTNLTTTVTTQGTTVSKFTVNTNQTQPQEPILLTANVPLRSDTTYNGVPISGTNIDNSVFDVYFTTKKYNDQRYVKLPPFPANREEAYVLTLGTNNVVAWVKVSELDIPVLSATDGIVYITD